MSEAPHTEYNNAAEELGQLLRHTREQRLLSIGDVSEHLKLPARQVEALENADFSKLPEAVFVRGFLRSYGRHLELDEEGQAWWVCPRETRTIGLFGGADIIGAVLLNASTGELTGTPTATGSVTLTLVATNAVAPAALPLSITVIAAAPVAVPTLGTWALGWMAALMAWLGRRRWQPRATHNRY